MSRLAASVSITLAFVAVIAVALSGSIARGDRHGRASTSAGRRLDTLRALPAHPRVWMTPDRVARLRARAGAGTDRWQRVRAVADAEVQRGSAAGDVRTVPDLCEAYLATGERRYADRAGVLLSAYAVDRANLEGDSGYPYRFWMPLVTMGLDWCYNGLTAAVRHQVATWLMNRADWVWPETNPRRAKAWGMWAGSNYWWGFMMTGPAALAAEGDDTVTGTTSGADRPAFHRQLALDHWTRYALPYFAKDGAGGAWVEGTNYDSSWSVGRFLDAFLTSGTPLSTPWLTASLQWRLASTTPGGGFKIPFGDQPRESNASLYAYDRLAAMAILAVADPPPPLAAAVQRWLNLIGQVPDHEAETSILAEEFLRYDPDARSAADWKGMPLDYLAPGAGYFTYRQSWSDPNATMFALESGAVNQSHAALDANGLRIWKGSFWVSADANIYSSSGIEQGTENYNNLTVGDTGQNHREDSRGAILSTQVSDSLVVVRAQARDAYGRSDLVRPLSDYLRTVVYLPRQDVFVVVDRATATEPAQAKVWRWHTRDTPVVQGNSFVLRTPGGDAGCLGHVLLPAGATLGVRAYTLRSGGSREPTSHAVTVSMSGRATDVVVTTFQCMTGRVTGATPLAATNAAGVTVTVGSTRITVPGDERAPVSLSTAGSARAP